jgi:dihydrofolate reductase
MNEIPKVVFTRNKAFDPAEEGQTTNALKDAMHLRGDKKLQPDSSIVASWTRAEVAYGDLHDEIMRLKQQPGEFILAHGGAGFAQSLVKSGLIDEYRLLIHPVALGSGLPIFSALSNPLDLELVETIAFKGGAVAHVYRPAGK